MSATQINWLPYLQILQGLAPGSSPVSGSVSPAVQAEAMALIQPLTIAGQTYDSYAGNAQGVTSTQLATWAATLGGPAWQAVDTASRLTYQLICGSSGPAAWQALTQYSQAIDGVTLASTVSGSGYVQICTFSGASGSPAPSWPTTVGATVSDGGVFWTCACALFSSPTTPVAFDPGLSNQRTLNANITAATELATLARRTDCQTIIGNASSQWSSALQVRPSTSAIDANLATATLALQVLIEQVQALQAIATTFQ